MVMIFDGVGAGGPDWGGGNGGRRGNGREPDGTGSWGQEYQMAGEEGDRRGRRARWQLLGVVGQEGKMTGVVGHEADGREPDGAGAVDQGGPAGQEGEDGRMHQNQMTDCGGSGGSMGQEFNMVGRKGPDQGVRGS